MSATCRLAAIRAVLPSDTRGRIGADKLIGRAKIVMQRMRLESAALQDFHPDYDRCGSQADVTPFRRLCPLCPESGQIGRCHAKSALCRKRPHAVPNATGTSIPMTSEWGHAVVSGIAQFGNSAAFFRFGNFCWWPRTNTAPDSTEVGSGGLVQCAAPFPMIGPLHTPWRPVGMRKQVRASSSSFDPMHICS